MQSAQLVYVEQPVTPRTVNPPDEPVVAAQRESLMLTVPTWHDASEELALPVALAVADAQPVAEDDAVEQAVPVRLLVAEPVPDELPETDGDAVHEGDEVALPEELALPVALAVADAQPVAEDDAVEQAVPVRLLVAEPVPDELPEADGDAVHEGDEVALPACAPPSAERRSMHTTRRAEKLTTDVIRRGAVVGRSDDEAAPGLWSKAGRYRRRPAIASGRAKPEKSIASGSKLNTVKIVKSHGQVRCSRGSARANMLSFKHPDGKKRRRWGPACDATQPPPSSAPFVPPR